MPVALAFVMIVTCRRQGTDEHIPRRRRPLARAADAAQARRARARRSLASVAMSGVISRGARAALGQTDPCACSPSQPATRCGIRRGAGCTAVCCPTAGNWPKCCQWPGVDHLFPNSSSWSCINKPNSGPGFEAHTICCCPANTRCGSPTAGQLPCVPCPPGEGLAATGAATGVSTARTTASRSVAARGRSAAARGAAGRAHVQTPALRFAARQVRQRCGRNCCHASQGAPAGHAAVRVAGRSAGPSSAATRGSSVRAGW